MDLTGLNAIVTGGASGIGRASAEALAEAGADVAVADLRRDPKLPDQDRPTDQLVDDAGSEGLFVETDVRDPDDTARLVAETEATLGTVDVVVNSAGTSSGGGVEDVSPEEWDRVFEVNVKGIYNTSRAALPSLRESTNGRVVNIASQLGLVAQPEYAAYCASKGAVVNLTRQMAIDYGPEEITVNAICPGLVETSRTVERLEDPDYRDHYERYNVLPFVGQPEDVGGTVAFVASSAARYMTGHCLVVDGGYTAH